MSTQTHEIVASRRYATKDAARLIGLSRATLTSWARQGIIKGYRHGHKLFFLGADLIARMDT